MVERIAAVAGHVNIFKAVVVKVSYCHAHPVVILWHSGEAGLFGYIGEGAVGILVIQAIPELAVGLIGQFTVRHRVVDLSAIGEEDVQTAVVVVVKYRHATPHRFHEILVGGGRVFVLEVDSARPSDVTELHL